MIQSPVMYKWIYFIIVYNLVNNEKASSESVNQVPLSAEKIPDFSEENRFYVSTKANSWSIAHIMCTMTKQQIFIPQSVRDLEDAIKRFKEVVNELGSVNTPSRFWTGYSTCPTTFVDESTFPSYSKVLQCLNKNSLLQYKDLIVKGGCKKIAIDIKTKSLVELDTNEKIGFICVQKNSPKIQNAERFLPITTYYHDLPPTVYALSPTDLDFRTRNVVTSSTFQKDLVKHIEKLCPSSETYFPLASGKTRVTATRHSSLIESRPPSRPKDQLNDEFQMSGNKFDHAYHKKNSGKAPSLRINLNKTDWVTARKMCLDSDSLLFSPRSPHELRNYAKLDLEIRYRWFWTDIIVCNAGTGLLQREKVLKDILSFPFPDNNFDVLENCGIVAVELIGDIRFNILHPKEEIYFICSGHDIEMLNNITSQFEPNRS